MKYSVDLKMGAKAYGRDLSISTKQSFEICNNIKGKSVAYAKYLLEKNIAKELPVPMKRYKKDTAHKKAIAAGKYPVNAATNILTILKSAESNAQNQGLSSKNLFIAHISAHKASTPWHYGRQRRRKMKRTHIQIILQEKAKRDKND